MHTAAIGGQHARILPWGLAALHGRGGATCPHQYAMRYIMKYSMRYSMWYTMRYIMRYIERGDATKLCMPLSGPSCHGPRLCLALGGGGCCRLAVRAAVLHHVLQASQVKAQLHGHSPHDGRVGRVHGGA